MFDFGKHLKELRQSKNITQKQLAQGMGASERGIQQYELGERKPTYDMLIALANYFKVPLDYLTGRSDSQKELCDKCGAEMVLGLMDGSLRLDGSANLSGYVCPKCSRIS